LIYVKRTDDLPVVDTDDTTACNANGNHYHLSQMERGPDKQKPRPAEPNRPLQASDLFRGRQEIVIEFRGETYRLRITRNDKLILTK
jgi:hemin uptake protein HemP